MSLVIADSGFELDGAPFQVISGALHYFRVHPDQWEDRLITARRMGLNTIETYIAWNFHESTEGEFRLDGWRDLGRFLDLAAEQGLKAIVRPGPYICAEWRNAGLPAWLTAKDMVLRSADPAFLDAVEQYFAQVLPVVAERQITRGGNVILVQVENEYGAYGDDKAYLRELVRLTREAGIDVPLLTCDQANDEMLERGSLPELLTTATFGSRAKERFEILRRHQPTGPLMCMEFWNGWFDSWGQHHHTTPADTVAADLDDLLQAGGSVNFYMLHGGTNFALYNGANHKGTYHPITTSYDYDAPIREDGSAGPKYWAFRDVIARHTGVDLKLPDDRAKGMEIRASLHVAGDWQSALREPVTHAGLPSIDQVAPEASFVVYGTDISADDSVIWFEDVRDRAFAFLDGEPIGSIQRTQRQQGLALPRRAGRLTLLVEDLGRVNYGIRIGESKGLIGPARTAIRTIDQWQVSVVDHDALASGGAAGESTSDDPLAGPVQLQADFDAEEGRDLYLDTDGFGAGIAWINGFPLGRYWSAGPTRTLYVPGPVVRSAGNRLVMWELEGARRAEVQFLAQPNLGHTEA